MGEEFTSCQTEAMGGGGAQPNAASPEMMPIGEASPEECPVNPRSGKRKRRVAVPAACAAAVAALVIWWIARPAPGPERLTFGSWGGEEILWRVLEEDENWGTLILSEYILDAKPYNEDRIYITWEVSTLRTWLNRDFFNAAFTEEEKERIREAHIVNEESPISADTLDRIFLLSMDELEHYFPIVDGRYDYPRRAVKPTKFAIQQGAHVDDENDMGIWWLRSPDRDSSAVAYVQSYGGEAYGIFFEQEHGGRVGVRPALWLIR